MPYVIVSGNLNPVRNNTGIPAWKVHISGLKAFEMEDLKRFTMELQTDAHTVIFKHHPIVLLNALEVLGYRVVSSFSSGSESSVWTMRKDFPEPCPTADDSSSDDDDDEE